MRMLMRVQMDTTAGNSAIRDGSMGQSMQQVLQELQPEAAYFTATDGKRTAFIVFDLKDPSDMPVVAEPFFEGMNASVHMSPCMTPEDLQGGLEKLSQRAAATV